MKNLSAAVAIFTSVMLLGCGQSGPSDYSLKGAAAMSDPASGMDYSGKSKFDNLEIVDKKCTPNQEGNLTACTFKLGSKAFSVQMIRTGSAWSYKAPGSGSK